MGEGDRPRFLPPTAQAPRYDQAPRAGAAPVAPPRASASALPGRNYSSRDPGLPGERPGPGAPPALEPANGHAVAAVVLGCAGLIIWLATFGVLAVNLICSLLAWGIGARARRRPGHRSMAQAGMIMGIVGTVLGILTIVVLAVIVTTSD